MADFPVLGRLFGIEPDAYGADQQEIGDVTDAQADGEPSRASFIVLEFFH